MIKKYLRAIFFFLQKIIKKRIILFSLPKMASMDGRTAVKSEFGFWYVGNVFDSQDIAYGIAKNGKVEPEGSKLVKNILIQLLKQKEPLSFYDIGSNTGYYGIMAAFLGQGKINTVSFDPVKEYNTIEKETVFLNRLEKKVKIFNLCLGDTEGEVEIFLAGSGTTMKVEFLGHTKSPVRKVPIRTLDSFSQENNLTLPDFIKIDVEGAEFAVLKGASGILKTRQPIIWYESAKRIDESNYENKDFHKTQEFLQSLGYEIFFCGENRIEAAIESKIPNGVWMYLALPQKYSITEFNYAE